MDQARFEEGLKAYQAKDYRAATKHLLAAAGRGEGSGAAYHMAGNGMVRLRRYADAVTIYRHALADETYERRGSVYANLGAAHVALGEYAEAVRVYDTALEEPDYEGQYRALQGKAGALLEMGKLEEAAAAYRQAALDSDNPDPGKALNNLGLCFMAMDRATDAIEAYRAALGFDDYTGRGRALANLGMAYHSIGCYEDAMKFFEKATKLHDHKLSEPAQEAFAASEAALRTPAEREAVDGWSTDEMPPVADSVPESEAEPDDAPEETPGMQTETTSSVEKDDEVRSFFSMTEDEMRRIDKEARRAERAGRGSRRSAWAVIGSIGLTVALVVGILVAAFLMGIGYPTQRMTVEGMLEARSEGRPVAGYWVAVPTSDVDREMAKLPPVRDFAINEVERSPRTSRVTVTVTPENGAPLHYEVSLVREGVGWKVTGVENDWRSTGGDF